jgi:rhodanese-related sulfurtransferase
MDNFTSTVTGAVAAAIVVILTVSNGFTQSAPPIPKEAITINGDQLKKMLDGTPKPLLVDTRNQREFNEGRIPLAIHVYDKDMEAKKAKFPADKNSPIVFYCNGYPKCPRSVNAATIALGWGYKKVYVYLNGIPEWEQKGYPVER